MGSLKQYLDLYCEARELLFSHSAPALNVGRDEAFKWLLDHPALPTRKCEAYRYTDVEAAFAPDYGLNLSRLDIPVDPYEAFRCDVPNLSSSLYFVINDIPKAPPQPSQREGALAAGEWRAHAGWSCLPISKSNFIPLPPGGLGRGSWAYYLNALLAQDGVYIHVAAGVKVERPIQLVNILRSDVDLMANRRVIIELDEGAEATLLVCDHTADDRNFLVNEVTEVRLARGASLQLYALEENGDKVQRFTHTNVQQGEGSRFSHTAVTLGTGLSCNRVNVSLDGEQAACNLYGAVIADGRQHVDHGTVITHNAPRCESHQLYKYILDGEAVGAFAGRVLVPHDMQQTVSDMVNANLLASETARVYTQPMLEIYADDVQCSHGSTVGQLSDAALIYMRQRGIPEDEARMLLKEAFASQVIASIQLPTLRDRLTHLVEKRFRGGLAHCEGCKLCKK